MSSTTAKSSAFSMLNGLVWLLFVLAPLVTMRLSPNSYQGGLGSDEKEKARRNSNAFAVILGEFRTNMSDFMYIKTERYMHSGQAMKPHIDLDEAASSGGVAAKTGAIVERLIPDAKTDFRGFIGELQRKVAPYTDPSAGDHHTSGKELLPWYRMMTLSNPNNVRAYLIGSWWLRQQGPGAVEEAIKFIREGIGNNPESYQLYLQLGYLINDDLKHGAEAKDSFLKAAELAFAARPQGVVVDDTHETEAWSVYNEEDARAAMRMAVLTEKEHGDKSVALELARKYVAALGGDGVLERQVDALKGQGSAPAAASGPPAPARPAKHGGIVIAAPGGHQVEGVMASPRDFRAYLYDAQMNPLDASTIAAGVTAELQLLDEKLRPVGEPRRLPLKFSEGPAPIILALLPADLITPSQITLRIRFADARDFTRFDFTFEKMSAFAE